MKVTVAQSFWDSLNRLNSPGHYYRVVKGWIRSHLFRKESWGILKQWFRGYAWDSSYLFELEQAKLKEMIAYNKRNQTHMDWEYDVRNMEICVSLLDIILEKKKLFHFTGEMAFGEPDEDGNVEWLPGTLEHHSDVYVNKRNATRFLKPEQVERWFDEDIYREKAKALYYKIRYEHTDEWWD